MTRDDILTDLYRSRFVENYILAHGSDIERRNLEDAAAEVYCAIASLGKRTIELVHEGGGMDAVRKYVCAVIQGTLHGKYRTFHRYIVRPTLHESPTDEFCDACDDEEQPPCTDSERDIVVEAVALMGIHKAAEWFKCTFQELRGEYRRFVKPS